MSINSKLTGILGMLAVVLTIQGCAAFRPLKGIPARYLPDEYKAVSRENQRTINLSLLGQRPKSQHIVDRGDVLGVYVESILGIAGQAPPVNFPLQADASPTLGFPLQVRDDGTISLPIVGAIDVRGMTIRQVEEHLRKLFVDRKILKQGQDRIIVTLQKPRQVRVLVMRQESPQIESGGGAQLGGVNLGDLKRGSGRIVNLPVGENDVLHALAKTGGLPGLKAENIVYVIRRKKQNVVVAPSDLTPYAAPIIPNSPVPTNEPQTQLSQPAMPVTNANTIVDSGIVQCASWRYGGSQVETPVKTLGYQPAQDRANNMYSSYLQNSGIPQAVSPVQAPSGNSASQYSAPQSSAPSSRYAPAPTRSVPRNVQTPSPFSPSGKIPPVPSSVPVAPQAPQLSQPAGSGNGSGSYRSGGLPDSLGSSNTFNQNDNQNHNQNQSSNYRSAPVPSGRYSSSRYSSSPYRQSAPIVPTAPAMQAIPDQTVPNRAVPSQAMPYQAPVQTAQPSYQPLPQMAPPVNTQSQWTQATGNQNLPKGFPTTDANTKILRIPIRLSPGEQINFTEKDIILHDGDVIFIESRETEIYYTGGLLGGGQYTLPRDYDLDILSAISIAQSPTQNVTQVGRNTGGISAVNGDVTISASDAIILRQLADGTQISIKVDLYKALRHPEERVVIKPRDVILLQYKKAEAFAAFFERHLLEGALFGIAAAQLNSGGGG